MRNGVYAERGTGSGCVDYPGVRDDLWRGLGVMLAMGGEAAEGQGGQTRRQADGVVREVSGDGAERPLNWFERRFRICKRIDRLEMKLASLETSLRRLIEERGK